MSAVTVQEVIDCLDYGDRMACNQMVGRIRTHGIAPPEGMALVEHDSLESYMQALYGASKGAQNFYANCADEIRAMLAAAPKQENSND